jgi:membrane protease YdiL (CAAX protease family)
MATTTARTAAPSASRQGTPWRATIRAFIRRHPVPAYYALAFAISWGGVLVLVGPGGLPATPEQRMTMGLAMLAGPSVASLLLTGVVSGRAGLREVLARLLNWRVGGRWYAVALLTAPLLTAAVALALSLRSPEFLPEIAAKDGLVTLLLSGLAAGVLIGICEELGWTGFALPRLRLRYGVLRTGLLLGVLWGAWHFLLFWEGDSFSGALPLALLLVRLFAWLPAYRVLMVWVHDRTGSLLVAVLMHASLAATQLTVPPAPAGGAMLTSILGWAAALWVVVAAVAVAKRWQLSRRSFRARLASRAGDAARPEEAQPAAVQAGRRPAGAAR